MPKLPQTFINMLVGILVINVIGLWTVHWYFQQKPTVTLAPVSTRTTSSNENTSQQGIDLSAKNSQDLKELERQFDALQTHVASIDAKLQKTTQKQTFTTTTTTSSAPQENYIFLGTGSTDNRDWTDLSGTVTTINTAYYTHIKSVVFEADLSAVGGEAHARLINKTTGAILDVTEVSNNTQSAQWVTSPVFSLAPGENEYEVELLSTSGEQVELTGARIKIVTQ